MSDRVGLRCKVIIKEDYIEDINTVMKTRRWDYCKNELLKEYGEEWSANCIPFGLLEYMPDEWENKDEYELDEYEVKSFKATDGFDRYFNTNTGEWNFQCSLRNHDFIVEKFIDILEIMVKEIIHLEYYLDGNDDSILYKLNEDGKIVNSGKRIRYRFWDF